MVLQTTGAHGLKSKTSINHLLTLVIFTWKEMVVPFPMLNKLVWY